MARTKTSTTELATTPPINSAAVADIQQTGEALLAAGSADRDLINQLIGQVQMASASEQFFLTIRASKLAYIKENKLYKGLQPQTANGSECLTGTWAGFCALIGCSVDKVDLDISNLKAFGEQALNSMNDMGIGYRQMAKYRTLPSDEKEALIEVAKNGDKDSFVELAETLIDKHSKDKATLIERAEEAEQDCLIKNELLEAKNKKIDALDNQVCRIRTLQPDEQQTDLREECSTFVNETEHLIRIQLCGALRAVNNYGMDSQLDQEDYLASQLDYLDDALLYLRREIGIERSIPLSNAPEWEPRPTTPGSE